MFTLLRCVLAVLALVPLVTTGPALGGGPAPQDPPPPPPQKVDNGSPAQVAAVNALIMLRKPDPSADLTRVSERFLRVIGKPLDRFDREKKRPFNEFYAKEWLVMAASRGFPRDATVGPVWMGWGRIGVAVFVGTFTRPVPNPNGRYLIRMVEEGKDNWKLDWFQVGPVPSNEAAAPATAEDPFKDFAVQSFADLVAVPPGNPPEVMDRMDRAPLAAALFTKKLLASDPFKASLDKENEQGYDYDRARLAGHLDLFLDGRVKSYTHAPVPKVPDTHRVVFTLEGGAKKRYDLKLVFAAPGLWQVDEIRLVAE